MGGKVVAFGWEKGAGWNGFEAWISGRKRVYGAGFLFVHFACRPSFSRPTNISPSSSSPPLSPSSAHVIPRPSQPIPAAT